MNNFPHQPKHKTKFFNNLVKGHPHRVWGQSTTSWINVFANGLTVSVLCGPREDGAYSDDKDLFEVSVYDSTGKNPMKVKGNDSDDVWGYQTFDEVEALFKLAAEH